MVFALASTFVSAASKTKNVSGSCNGGYFSESIQITVTLATANNPSYKYSNQKHTVNAGYRWSGISHKKNIEKVTSDHFKYKNTATGTWIDYNYANSKISKSVTFDYHGTLS